MSQCKQVCLVCNEPSRYFFVNKTEYHALCYNCANGIQVENIGCKICGLDIKIEFLRPDENAKLCGSCNKNITAKVCPSANHYICLDCRKNECRLCKCEFCGKKSNEMAYHAGHSICGSCYHRYGLCPLCNCINCKTSNTNSKHNDCNHPCCQGCKSKPCKLCFKICEICKTEGDHKAKRCDLHFYCFKCFQTFGKIMGQKCLICTDDRTYKCIECGEYDINAKSLCDTPHTYCSKCIKIKRCGCEECLQCRRKLECDYCNENRHKVCMPCKSTGICEPCEEYKRNLEYCSNCDHETTKQIKFPCGEDHFACLNCLHTYSCSKCIKVCCNCNEQGYFKNMCTSGHANCGKQECISTLFQCGKHSDCPECIKVNYNCQYCTKKCDFCPKTTYIYMICGNSHTCCKECLRFFNCGNHYECPACYQSDDCYRCLMTCNYCGGKFYSLKEVGCANHKYCESCFEFCVKKCKICMACSKCGASGIYCKKYDNCEHIYCSENCKENNGYICSKCITCFKCNNPMDNLQKVCQNCRDFIPCVSCNTNHGDMSLSCQNHRICTYCNERFKSKCPLCKFELFNSGVCDSCTQRTSDFSILNCDSHKVCQGCINKNEKCSIFCSQCNTHLKENYKKLRCSHFICSECSTINKSGKKIKCGICCINHKNQEGKRCPKCKDAFCKSCYSGYQDSCKNCQIKCKMCDKEAQFFCEDTNHGLCSVHSYDLNQCLFCNNYYINGRCYECDESTFVARSGCKHFLCFKCNIDFQNGCTFCKGSICKLCKIQTNELRYLYSIDNSNTGTLCCSNCLCSKCFKILGTEKYECGHNLCTSCRINENCSICFITCGICKTETKNVAECRHTCLDCYKNFQNCIFCTNKYNDYRCNKCNNFKHDITKFMYCVSCLLEYQNYKCHICHSNINSNDFIHRDCNFLLCVECNIYNTKIGCPTCNNFKKEQCKLCFETNYLYSVSKSHEVFSCLKCSLTKKITPDSCICHNCSQVYKNSEKIEGYCPYCYKLCKTCSRVYKNDDSYQGDCTSCNNLCHQCNKIYKKNESIEGGCPDCYRLCFTCKSNYNLIDCHYKNIKEFNERVCVDCQGIKPCKSCEILYKSEYISKKSLCVNCNLKRCSVCKNNFKQSELKNKICNKCSEMVTCCSCKGSFRLVLCVNLGSDVISCQECAEKIASCNNCKILNYKQNLNQENLCQRCLRQCSNCKFEKLITEFHPDSENCNECVNYSAKSQKSLNILYKCEKCSKNGYENDFYNQSICKSCKQLYVENIKEAEARCRQCNKKYPGRTSDPSDICECKAICDNCKNQIKNELIEFQCRHRACKNCCQNTKLKNNCPCCFELYKCPNHPTEIIIVDKKYAIFHSNCCKINICTSCKRFYNQGHFCT